MREVRVHRQAEGSTSTAQTAGMQRTELITQPDTWVGTVRSDPGAVSGWHHHGDYDSYICLTSGGMKIEHGPCGREAAEGRPGDVIHVPKHTIHRESTIGDQPAEAFLIRVGSGDPVFNVDGPEPV